MIDIKKRLFAWLNNELTLRNAGVKTDVYAVFKNMLDREEIPSTREGRKPVDTSLDQKRCRQGSVSPSAFIGRLFPGQSTFFHGFRMNQPRIIGARE